MPTTSACYDTSDCTGHIGNCYENHYKAVCCDTCNAAYDANALFGCEYGDKFEYCSVIEKDQCLQYVSE